MDIRTLFRATIPGYALIISFFVYLWYIAPDMINVPIIAAFITAGFPFGVFLEFIIHTINHLRPGGHFVIRKRIRTTESILGINHPERTRNISRWNDGDVDSIREHYLRGFFNFVLNSNEKFKSHRERHAFLASRTHCLLESILGIILGNFLGFIALILTIIKNEFCLQKILVSLIFMFIVFLVSLVFVAFFWFLYLICRNDLMAYERMLIRVYRLDFNTIWSKIRDA